jgi:hypothetical protein
VTCAAEATYSAKIAYLAGIIRSTGADAAVMQEIGSADAAEDLRAALGALATTVLSGPTVTGRLGSTGVEVVGCL